MLQPRLRVIRLGPMFPRIQIASIWNVGFDARGTASSPPAVGELIAPTLRRCGSVSARTQPPKGTFLPVSATGRQEVKCGCLSDC